MSKDIEESRKFLQSERRVEEKVSTSKSNLHELIKCFCGICETWFSRKNIEYALKSNSEEILRDNDSRNILRKFAIYRKGSSNFKTSLEEILDCFELSLAILNGDKKIDENREDLEDLCYTEYWENYLTKSIDDGTTNDFFHDLIRESALRLENNEEFAIFKIELRKKLKLDS